MQCVGLSLKLGGACCILPIKYSTPRRLLSGPLVLDTTHV